MYAAALTVALLVSGGGDPAALDQANDYQDQYGDAYASSDGTYVGGGDGGGCFLKGRMPQTCYQPRYGCYHGNERHMHRYPAFHGTYYRRPYNYRNYFDYPWHARPYEPTSMFSYNTPEAEEDPRRAATDRVPTPAPEFSASKREPTTVLTVVAEMPDTIQQPTTTRRTVSPLPKSQTSTLRLLSVEQPLN